MSLHVEPGPVWTVVFDRARRANALSAVMVDALHATLDDAVASGADALVLRGNPRHFAAGIDLTDLESETDATLGTRLLRIGVLLERLATVPMLTIAVAEGTAVGAGADLLAACDQRLIGAAVRVGFPGAGFGLALGAHRLAALTGRPTPVVSGRVPASGLTGLATGTPEDLDDVLAEWAAVHPSVRPELLAAARRPTAAARAEDLAALARTLARPGLRHRVAEHAGRVDSTRTSIKESA